MATDYVMPKLAMGMNEGTVVAWLAKEGQHIEKGAPLCQVETEKVVYDVEAPTSGWFHAVVAPGTTVPAESLIGQFAASEEEYKSLAGGGAPAPSAPAREAAKAAGGAVPGGVSTAAETVPAAAPGGRVRSSPLARKLAKDKNIDLATVAGTGPGGRIVKRDVLAAEAAPKRAAPAAAAAAAPGALTVKATVPLKGMRAAIARRMVQSLTQAAQVSQFAEMDVTKLIAAREAFLAREKELGTRVSVNAFIVKAMAVACKAVPIANSCLVDEEIVLYNEVNVGIAVAIRGQTEWDSGLVVPVLRNVESKGLVQIDLELRDIIGRTRAGQLKPGEMEGGTITLSPTGALTAEAIYSWSTPIINQPQALIIQPGMAMERAVARNGQVVVRTMMPMSLTFDHRILDGAPVGMFYEKMHQCLENPELMLG